MLKWDGTLIPPLCAHMTLCVLDSRERVNQSQCVFGNILRRDLLINVQFSSAILSLNSKIFKFLKRGLM